MNALVERLRYSHGNKHLIGKTLSRAATIATSVGVLAEGGKQFTITERVKDVFVGTIQVGEYILTGEIPSAGLVASVLAIAPESSPDAPVVVGVDLAAGPDMTAEVPIDPETGKPFIGVLQ